MGAATTNIDILINAKDSASRTLDKVSGSAKGLETSFGGMVKTAGLATAAFAALATAAAVVIGVKVIKGVGEFAVETAFAASRAEELGFALNAIGKANNIAQEEIDNTVKSLRDSNIANQEALQITSKFIQAELDLADATKLTGVAQDLAVISGQDSSDAANTLTDAIVTNSAELLRNFGIVTTVDTVLEEYGATIGKASDELTEAERKQAFLNTILEEGGKVAGTYDAAMGSVSKQFRSLTGRVIPDFKEKIGEAFTPALAAGVDFVKDSIGVLSTFIDDNKDAINDLISKAIEPVINAFKFLGDKLIFIVENLDELKEAFNRMIRDFDAETGVITAIKDEFDDLISTVKDELIPLLIENKDEFIVMAKVIGAIVIVSVVALAKAINLTIDAMVLMLNINKKLDDSFETSVRNITMFFTAIVALGDRMEVAGIQIIDGLIAGLSQSTKRVLTVVKGIADGIAGAFRGAMVIKSPSKVFEKLGAQTMEGLQVGFEKKKGDIEKQVIDIAKKIEDLTREKLTGTKERNKEITSELFELRVDEKELKGELKIIEDTFKTFSKRVEDFSGAFDILKDKTTETFDKFKSRISDARDSFTEFKDSVKGDIANELESFAEGNKERKENLDQSIAEEIISLEERTKSITDQIAEEQKREKGGNADKIADLVSQRDAVFSILAESAEDRKKVSAEIAEIERFNNLNPIEQLKDRFIKEKEEAKKNKDERIAELKDGLKTEREATIESLKKIRKRRREILENMKKDFKSTVKDIKNLLGELSESTAGAELFNLITGLGAQLTAGISQSIGVQKFATGGVVQGPGGTDSVPALLTPGETVLPPGVPSTTIEVNFNNATVRNESDLDAIIRAVKESLDRESQLTRIGI